MLSLMVKLSLGQALAAPQAADTTAQPYDPAFDLSFPDNFTFSVATASYQVEGAWNESGKGEGIWDRMTHEHPERILDRSNGDVACDSYHKYKEDIQLIKAMGVGMYRFSLSWSRLLPTAAIDKVNQDGIDYYNNLIDECISNNIEPMVTLFHFDLPQPLQDLGGLPNDVLVGYFTDYAEFAFKSFGKKVKMWLTLNEPLTMCVDSYGLGSKAPNVKSDGRADYLCAHTSLNAHASAYRLYQEKFAEQGGKIGMAVNSKYFMPKDPTNADDVAAANRWLQFNLGWFAHPVFSKDGDYPEEMKTYVHNASIRQGLKKSRLPEFTPDEIDMLKGSADFFAMNIYSSMLVSHSPPDPKNPRSVSRTDDASVELSTDPNWEKTIAPWFLVVPEGMRPILNWIKNQYNNPQVFITENGYPDGGNIKDLGRVNYYRLYLLELLKAMHYDNCNVFGYTAWSLMDNYEWAYGYVYKFGLHHVDFTDPARPRRRKMSAEFYSKLIATRRVPKNGDIPFPDDPTTTTSQPSSATSNLNSVIFLMSLLTVAGLAST